MSAEYPGVYVEEIPSGARKIEGVPTSRTGFIGSALKGPVDQPVHVNNFAEYEKYFGGLWLEGPMSYAIRRYFENGGLTAVVVRVVKNKTRLVDQKTPLNQIYSDDCVGFYEIADSGLEAQGRGLWAFDQDDPINLLCIPPFAPQEDVDKATWQGALRYCKTRKAFLIVDPPSTWKTVKDASLGIEDLDLRDPNAAIYFPTLQIPDPLNKKRIRTLAPGGAVAGVIARTDLSRAVWKAPAGVNANLINNPKLSLSLDDLDIERLSQRGINCFRDLSNIGSVVWGARTLIGDDQHTSEWKYISVRRTALFIEASLERGLQWTVFEPNDEPLWAQIRLNVDVFMNELFRLGAFAGSSPNQAYFVKCDQETITPGDIVQGKVNLVVGFATLRPAEFVIIKLELLAGQTN